MFFCVWWILSLALPSLYSPWQEGMSAMCRGARPQRKMFPKLGLSFAACNKAGKLLSISTSTFTSTLLPPCSLQAASLLLTPAHSWGAAAPKLRSYCWPKCQGVPTLPERRGGDQLLPSLHTSLSHTSPGRMNGFHHVLNSAFSLFLNLLLLVFTASMGKKKKRQ